MTAGAVAANSAPVGHDFHSINTVTNEFTYAKLAPSMVDTVPTEWETKLVEKSNDEVTYQALSLPPEILAAMEKEYAGKEKAKAKAKRDREKKEKEEKKAAKAKKKAKAEAKEAARKEGLHKKGKKGKDAKGKKGAK